MSDNDTTKALRLIHLSLVDIKTQLDEVQAGIAQQTKREEQRLDDAERRRRGGVRTCGWRA